MKREVTKARGDRVRGGGVIARKSRGQTPEMSWSLVNLAPVRDPRDRDEFRRVVDDVQHAPVTDPDAPLVLVAFQLFASCGPWCVAQRVYFFQDTSQHVIR